MKYSVAEIEELREAIRKALHVDAASMNWQWLEGHIEDRLRTFMSNGTKAEEVTMCRPSPKAQP